VTKRGRVSEEQLRREFRQWGLPPRDPTFRFDHERWAVRPRRRRPRRRWAHLWEAAAAAAMVGALVAGHLTAHVVRSPAAPAAKTHPIVGAVRRIALGAISNPVVAGHTVRLAGTAYAANGRHAAHTSLKVLGLPTAPAGETVTTDASGHFTLRATWEQPGTYTLIVSKGTVHASVTVVVHAATSASQTPSFAGAQVQFFRGTSAPPAIPAGYVGVHLAGAFSSGTYHRVEGFTGILAGHPFIVDLYSGYPSGLFIGVNYNHQPVLFAAGPAPVFDVLNFTGDWMVLGDPAAGAYEAINLTSGRVVTRLSQVIPLKGYSGLTPPPDILGLPGIQQSVTVPYGPTS